MISGTIALLVALAQPVDSAAGQAAAAVPAVEPPAASRCELHVWPTGRMVAVPLGLSAGPIRRSVPSSAMDLAFNPLDPAIQRGLLTSAGLAARLGIGSHAVIVHATPLDRVHVRRHRGKLNPDAPDCYAELVVEDLFYQFDISRGRALGVMIRYADFGDGSAAPRSYGDFVSQPLFVRPPERIEQPLDLTRDAVGFRNAFTAALVDFTARTRVIVPPPARPL